MGCRQCLTLSVVQLKGKHCRKPHCSNGVVYTFGPCDVILQVAQIQISKKLVKKRYSTQQNLNESKHVLVLVQLCVVIKVYKATMVVSTSLLDNI